MISLLITLIIVGLVLYLISTLPIDARIKNVIHVVVVVLMIIWLLESFGLFAGPTWGRHGVFR